MKKLLFFFSTLLFIFLPNVRADFEPMEYYLYFSNNSTDNYFKNTVDSIKNTKCTFDYCVYGGATKTVAENLDTLVTELKNYGYTFFMKIGYSSSSSVVSSLNYLYIDIIDTKKTSSNLSLYHGKTTLDTLEFLLSDSPINEYNSSNGVYSWKIGPGYLENYDINSINDYVKNNSSSQTHISVVTMENGTNGTINARGYFPYYTNLKYDYKISPFSFKIFTDYIGASGNPLSFTINDTVGHFYNRTMMLSWYVNDFVIDNDNIIPGEKPNEEDKDASNQDIVDGLGDLNDSINSTDTSGAQDIFGGFFEGFKDNNYGLSDIIKTPLVFIQSLSKQTCTPINLPLPFVNQNLVLPCIKPIFEHHFSPLLTVYQLVTFGFISYFIVINIFKTVRGFKNPDSNNVEVLEL